MSINMKREFDPIYETMMLLYEGYDLEKFKNFAISQINDLGGNGEDVYQRHLKVFDKFVRAFHKNRVQSDRDEFYFKDTSNDFYNSFIALFLLDESLIYTIGQMDNNQIMDLIFRHSNEIFEHELPEYSYEALEEFKKAENLITLINILDLDEKEKWKVFMILQNPKDYFSHFAKLVQDNIQAYEKSVEVIKPSLGKPMEQYYKKFSDEDKMNKFLEDNNMINCDIQEIIPSMATAPGIIITSHTCYYGILFDNVLDEFGLKGNGTTEYLLTCLKALSDHSKFEILTSLKACPKYATELAAQLGLTPATVSHHMGTLLASRLVYVEKENGKYYYHVDETSVNDMMEQLRQMLL
jgi:DNA-binding transcriptional ArsR family regulator